MIQISPRRVPTATFKPDRSQKRAWAANRDVTMTVSEPAATPENLALYDAETFANAARDYVNAGDESGLRAYSGTCLARTWRYQEYADWWSHMFFSRCGERAAADPYAARVAEARLARFTEPSSAAALAWGELMTGLA